MIDFGERDDGDDSWDGNKTDIKVSEVSLN